MSQTRDLDDLVAFLAARYAEEYRKASDQAIAANVAESRAMRDVDAKRAIVMRYVRASSLPESLVSFTRGQDDGYRQAGMDAIRDLAAVYSDHPDYRAEWAPVVD